MNFPLIVSTWSWGVRANAAGWELLLSRGALDAVEAAARDAESDLANHTVGRGGYPDASGRVSLDAAVMVSPSRHGAVACVRGIEHPITLARAVMEQTPHRLLVGTDADAFAWELGLPQVDLLTDAAATAYARWRESGKSRQSLANVEEVYAGRASDMNANHDTIGVIAIDGAGVMAAGTTTSGLAFKRPGRVGDSPIVGAGLYCDPAVGACVCTGLGELAQGTCAAFLATELLRSGQAPQAVAQGVIERVQALQHPGVDDQMGVIVVSADGAVGSASLLSGFKVAMRTPSGDTLCESAFVLKPSER